MFPSRYAEGKGKRQLTLSDINKYKYMEVGGEAKRGKYEFDFSGQRTRSILENYRLENLLYGFLHDVPGYVVPARKWNGWESLGEENDSIWCNNAEDVTTWDASSLST